jgi:hypothetical protein
MSLMMVRIGFRLYLQTLTCAPDKGNPYNHWFGGPIQPRSRRDSVSSQNNGSNRDQMPEPALEAARTLPGFISGQTKTGWYHWRDPSK